MSSVLKACFLLKDTRDLHLAKQLTVRYWLYA
jgi:hypothetical protein